MQITTHLINDIKIAEVHSDELVIGNAEDALQLLGDLYYQGFDKMILHEQNITPVFFELKSGMAGEILQKFSNYRMRMAIVGDLSRYPGQSIRDFIFESNKSRQIQFVTYLEDALN